MARHEGIVVIGPPRSGTTLLRRLLDAHPNISCPSETNLLAACARFLHHESIAGGPDIGVLSGLEYVGFPEDEVLERLRAFALSFPREVAARAGKGRWAEKSAFDVFYLDAIERLLGGRAYFVCLERHGLDVVCSLAEFCERSGGYVGELFEYVRRTRAPLEAFAHAWVDATRNVAAFAERHPQDAMLIKYEALAADPESVLREVLRFVEEPWHPGLVAAALDRRDHVGFGDWKSYARRTIDEASVGRHRALSPATRSRLGRIVNPTLVSRGYEAVPLDPPPSREESRRRYELGMRLQSARDGEAKKNPA
jgi:hypothetical protein